jgi:opacity protein-like surface antigen
VRSVTVVAGLLVLDLFGVQAACGVEPPLQAPLPRFELTPFLGYRFGGDLEVIGSDEVVHVNDHAVGAVSLSVPLNEQSQWGAFYSRQSTTTHSHSGLGHVGLDVQYIHLDSTLTGEYYSLFYPYLIGALGVTRLSVDAPDTKDDTRFSFAVGAGVRVPVSSRVAVRLETRAYMTFIDTSSSVFCTSMAAGSACVLRGRGTTFLQYDVLLGVAFGF